MKTAELTFIRRTVIVFIICLVLSGLTAFPLVTETNWLIRHINDVPPVFQNWVREVSASIGSTPPIVLYGTDWLAFAHIIIALFFISVYRNPVRNKFIVQVGMAACVCVFPLAFTCGPVRGIPFFHQLIDCGFGVLGLVPLYMVYRKIRVMEAQQTSKQKL